MSGLDDLEFEWCVSRQRKTSVRNLKKNKADWLNDNLLQVVQHLTTKNSFAVKTIQQHAAQFTLFQQKSDEKKVTVRKRNLVFRSK